MNASYKHNITLLFLILASLPAFSQFRMIGTASWTVVTDSTYSGTINFQVDLTGKGYLATSVVDTFRLFTGTEQIYTITSVGTKTFSSAQVTIKEYNGDHGIPIGQVMVYDPAGKTTLPQAPFGSTGSTAQLQAAVDTYNARLLSSAGVDLTPYSTTLQMRQEISDSIATVTGLADGDKGDITVSGSGATWTIDANAVDADNIATNAVGPDEIAPSGVAAASYTAPNITVDQDGRITSATSNTTLVNRAELGDSTVAIRGDMLTGNEAITLSGDVTGTGTTAITTTISAGVVGPTELENTVVTPGAYTAADITVDADGRITAAASNANIIDRTELADTALSIRQDFTDSLATTIGELNQIWYIDSRYGDDSHTGQSPAQAWKTLAKLKTIVSSGDFIYLAKGSYWRESFSFFPELDSIRIDNYGAGPLPIIDGSEAVGANWSKTVDRTNIYEYSKIIEDEGDAADIPVYEGENTLFRAANLDQLDTIPGSYFYVANTTTDIDFYVHTSNSDNPNTNGTTYYVTVKQPIALRNSNNVFGVHTRRGLDNDGPIATYEEGALENIIAEDGHKHNVFNGGGHIRNVVALNARMQGEGGTTLFVSYEINPLDLTAEYYNCHAVNARMNEAIDDIGFYAHGTTNFDKWQKLEFYNCTAYRLQSPVNPKCDSLIVQDCSFQDVNVFNFTNSNADTFGTYQYIAYNQIKIVGAEVGEPPQKGLMYSNAFFSDSQTATQLFRYESQDTIDFRNNTFVMDNRATLFENGGTGGGKCIMYNNVFFGRPQFGAHIDADTLTYEGDYNIFYAKDRLDGSGSNQVQLTYNGIQSTTLADWIDRTGQDQNSVWLTEAQASVFFIGDPSKGDFRINPKAEVTYVDPGPDTNYNTGDDVIRTLVGEFPDGTPITSAGVLPDFPHEWKPIPKSVDECYSFQIIR